MSFCKSNRNVVQESTQYDIPKKAYNKLDHLGKLQVINALDNGQSKSDIAKKYGVHPQTISYIYKQKESILRKYTQKYNLLVNDVRSAGLDQILFEWFKLEVKNGNVVNEEHLKIKAHETMKALSDDFSPVCSDDWLLGFRIRHNIAKYMCDVDCSIESKEDWVKYLKGIDVEDIYFGTIFALSHSLDYNRYVCGQDVENYISVLLLSNTVGTDKKEIAAVGRETLQSEVDLSSIPVNYYYCDCTQMNYSVIVNYLRKWDIDLKVKDRHVSLFLNVPDSLLSKLHFDNIKLLSTTNMKYVIKILDKIVECFKYHYRRLQISKSKVGYYKENIQFTLLDYINMISMAWYNVSYKYIQRLCFPLKDGTLYFKTSDETDGDHSLSKWCKIHNLNIDQNLNLLDQFIYCDEQLPSLYWGQSDTVPSTSEVILQRNVQPTSGVNAYQAMKRLVSYLQSESAERLVLQQAKILENHVEYGALLEIHQMIANTTD